jgi:ATP-dependent Clp protease ATP-binding subunit ClpA
MSTYPTPESIARRILVIRGHKVLLDAELAQLYGVETRALVQAVKRNAARVPDDFTFRLSEEEFASLRSQSVILKKGRGQHRKHLPYAFMEHGALMLGNVLRSPTAIAVSVLIVRAFVQLRALFSNQEELSKQLDQLEQRVTGHDSAIKDLLHAIRRLMSMSEPSKRPIGFTADLKGP